MERKTPLYNCHVTLGAKIVPFAGFLLPVQYSDVIKEHMAVRQAAGLFDVSHMGEFIISGPDALENLNRIFTNDFTGMADGGVRYSPMCNEKGGILDDLIVYRLAEDRYMLVPNAANREKDYGHISASLTGGAALEDVSGSVSQLALQGPASGEILLKLTDEKSIPQRYYTFTNDVTVGGVKCLLSRTGYTGEAGFELYCKNEDAEKLWEAIMKAGEGPGLLPCGLGARDTLRLEAAMPLYGHEMTEDISPLETGLAFAVKLDKAGFIGKQAIIGRGEPKIKRVGLRMTGRGIAREQNGVYDGGERVGVTTSGTHCPYLGGAYAMALVDTGHAETGTKLQVDVRGRRVDAEIVPLPFYKKQ